MKHWITLAITTLVFTALALAVLSRVRIWNLNAKLGLGQPANLV